MPTARVTVPSNQEKFVPFFPDSNAMGQPIDPLGWIILEANYRLKPNHHNCSERTLAMTDRKIPASDFSHFFPQRIAQHLASS
jgi:hypothetical protein